MFLFLFLLSNSFVMMIVDRNETKGDLSKKQIIRSYIRYYKSSQTKEKTK